MEEKEKEPSPAKTKTSTAKATTANTAKGKKTKSTGKAVTYVKGKAAESVKGNTKDSHGESMKIAPLFRKYLRPQKETPNLIAKLPPELRNCIYQLYLASSGKAYNLRREPPILRTCKQIRSEVGPIFYKRQCLFMGFGLHNIPRHLQKLQSLVTLCGPKPLASVQISVRGLDWGNLSHMLPLLEFMRVTGFEPAAQPYQPRRIDRDENGRLATGDADYTNIASVFDATPKFDGLERALERALEMGRKARDEGWTKERLESNFASWKDLAFRRRGQGKAAIPR